MPSIDTLHKCAQALKIRLYQLCYDSEEAPKKIKGLDLDGEKLSNNEKREIESLRRKFTKLKGRDKELLRLLVASWHKPELFNTPNTFSFFVEFGV